MSKDFLVKGADCLLAAFVHEAEKYKCLVNPVIKDKLKKFEDIGYLWIFMGTIKPVVSYTLNKMEETIYDLPNDWIKAVNALDGLFNPEPEIPEFKVGDWVVFQHDKAKIKDLATSFWRKDCILKVDRVDNSNKSLVFNPETVRNSGLEISPMANCSNSIECFRLATHEEIKEELIRQAEERGFIEGFNLSRIAKHYLGNIRKDSWKYFPVKDELYNTGVCIYAKGTWRTIQYATSFGDYTVTVKENGSVDIPGVGIVTAEELDYIYDMVSDAYMLDIGHYVKPTIEYINVGCQRDTFKKFMEIYNKSREFRGLKSV